MKHIRKISRLLLLGLIFMHIMNFTAVAELVNIEGNDYFTQTKIPTGKTGKMMNVTFRFTAGMDYESAWVGIAYDDQINSSDEKEDPDKYAFPFEVTKETVERKSIGKIKQGQTKSITITARVRRDIPEGYYGVPVYVADSKEGGSHGPQEYVNVWISKSTKGKDDKEDKEDVNAVRLVLGDEQEAPYGVYPNIMNFSINLANTGKVTAYDVRAEMILDKDSKVFPFDINEANYDRNVEKIAHGEVVQLPYSFAIRKDVYSGFYPIKVKLHYRESIDGPILSVEDEFFVHVKNKEEETESSEVPKEFNANDRTKARIVVDSFYTVPEKIIAGTDFELVLVMKNASTSVGASNILFSFESEKAGESSAITSDTGSNSLVVDSLAAGASTELRKTFTARAGIEQRSYALTIKEKYDSPEYKNAEESVSIEIPVYQLQRMSTGTIEITPNPTSVDSESNIIFTINNTGKVMLYNATAKFTADFIKENEMYVGNIEPGKTATVDIMLTATDINTGDKKVNIEISYEDVNGEVSSQKIPLELLVDEEVLPELPMDGMDDMDDEIKPPFYQNKIFLGSILLIVIIIVATVLIIQKRKKAAEEIDIDEIGD